MGLVQIQVISDDDAAEPVFVEVLDAAASSAAQEDPFAKLLESPELVKPPRGLSRAAQVDNANQKLLQQLRQGLADFKQNSKDLEDPDIEEISEGEMPSHQQGPRCK